jgi:hypothetical protein
MIPTTISVTVVPIWLRVTMPVFFRKDAKNLIPDYSKTIPPQSEKTAGNMNTATAVE